MALIQDIIVPEKVQKTTKTSPVRDIVAKLHLPHKKLSLKKPAQRDTELVDIIMRFRNR